MQLKMRAQSIDNPSICIFANFFIDNEERLQRMKDSFQSFCDAKPEEWRVNIRGRLKAEAGDYLRSQIGERLRLFNLESSKGWFQDSVAVMKEANSQYVLFWIEDHICIVNPQELRNAVNEMSGLGVEQLYYSWYLDRYRQGFEINESLATGQFLKCWQIDKSSVNRIKAFLQEDFFVVWATCVMPTEIFRAVIRSRKPLLKRWPRFLPFDFEKKFADGVFKEIRCAFPKKELFVAIDDDHRQPNYSLISRGLYPDRISRQKLKALEGLTEGDDVSTFKVIMLEIEKWLPRSVRDPLRYFYTRFKTLFRRLSYTLGYLIR